MSIETATLKSGGRFETPYYLFPHVWHKTLALASCWQEGEMDGKYDFSRCSLRAWLTFWNSGMDLDFVSVLGMVVNKDEGVINFGTSHRENDWGNSFTPGRPLHIQHSNFFSCYGGNGSHLINWWKKMTEKIRTLWIPHTKSIVSGNRKDQKHKESLGRFIGEILPCIQTTRIIGENLPCTQSESPERRGGREHKWDCEETEDLNIVNRKVTDAPPIWSSIELSQKTDQLPSLDLYPKKKLSQYLK